MPALAEMPGQHGFGGPPIGGKLLLWPEAPDTGRGSESAARTREREMLEVLIANVVNFVWALLFSSDASIKHDVQALGR